jgi:hypothetical protein
MRLAYTIRAWDSPTMAYLYSGEPENTVAAKKLEASEQGRPMAQFQS